MSCSVCAGYSSYNCPCCGEEVRMITCPDCQGTGYTPHRALNIHTREDVKVTAVCWDLLPNNEDIAAQKGENYCKLPRECCPTCKGDGEIPEDY